MSHRKIVPSSLTEARVWPSGLKAILEILLGWLGISVARWGLCSRLAARIPLASSVLAVFWASKPNKSARSRRLLSSSDLRLHRQLAGGGNPGLLFGFALLQVGPHGGCRGHEGNRR